VKTRTSADKRASRFGGAISSVTIEKQNNTVAAAREFLKTYSKRRFPRFDVIEVYFKKDESGKVESGNPERINHIPGAFRGTGKRY
jgi:Holliday junction resolvase-like predicted endonuclease